MMIRSTGLFALVSLLAAHSALAQIQIEKRRPAPPAGEVTIENDFGSLAVHGWEDKEVLVRGTLAPGAEGLDLDSDKQEVSVRVDVPENWFSSADDDSAFGSHLEIFAPLGSTLYVESVNADISVDGFRGGVEITTVNGTVSLSGPAREVEIDTMTGRVDVAVEGAPIDIESISGPVFVKGARGEVRVVSVSAPVEVQGSRLSSTEVETTTGAVVLRGSLAAKGEVNIETFSGMVTLVLPAAVKASFDLTSFSGQIRSVLGGGTPKLRERFSPYTRLRFATGLDGFEVNVSTHDADIVIETE
jgi:hypothetical protein